VQAVGPKADHGGRTLPILGSVMNAQNFRRSQCGAVIIQVAVALLALTAFSALVLDYGVLWASRGQAQNAADAGALSAAINLLSDSTNTTGAVTAAQKVAYLNDVWGQYNQAADVLVTTGLTCPTSAGGGSGCVRVDVERGATDRNGGIHTNTLPTFFANIFGLHSQAINATAMAQVTAANGVTCIKPWTIPDRWSDGDETPINGWAQTDVFNPPTDTYTQGVSGFKYPNDVGIEIVMKGDNNAWSAGWMQELQFPACTGSNPSCYGTEITSCPSWIPTVGLYDGSVPCGKSDTPDPTHGCIQVKPGVSQGPTSSGVGTLVGLDRSATWDSVNKKVTNSCMDTHSCVDANGNSIAISPRIIPIALFDPSAYWNENCGGNTCNAQVVNLFGYFLEGMCNDVYGNNGAPSYCDKPTQDVVGIMMAYPGVLLSGGTTTSTFAKAVRLVR
jgi:Putative Flp pilus-assembly TadE/G-like